MGVAVVVEVLEELVAGDVAAGFDDAGEAAVGEVDGVLDAGLAFEVEGEAGALMSTWRRRRVVRPKEWFSRA